MLLPPAGCWWSGAGPPAGFAGGWPRAGAPPARPRCPRLKCQPGAASGCHPMPAGSGACPRGYIRSTEPERRGGDGCGQQELRRCRRSLSSFLHRHHGGSEAPRGAPPARRQVPLRRHRCLHRRSLHLPPGHRQSAAAASSPPSCA
ncbi:uncharacterized protein LOC135176432 isoform X2 [Pogoniulus pusillus]|uniref:uncharacterized protein LOC135176432 isoform X2 n=1 Tax=Pogoniulus pusillus TaxID=488313 RepID=UPI0030B97FCC